MLLLLPLAVRFVFPAAEKYYLHLLIQILIWSFIYTGWSLMGRFGLTSLGHGAFTGIGAYVMVLLWNYGGITPWIGIPVAVVVSVVVALLVGYPCFHLRIIGHYFALLTLALTEFVRLCIVGLRDYTGGSLGTQPARYGDGVSLYALQFEPDRVLSYYVALALWAVGLYIWWRVDRSMDRYALDAASQDEDAAASVGIDVTREKLKITAISAAMCAVGGAIYAPVPDVYRAGHDRGPGRLAQHRVRRDRRRHVGDARADRRRGVHPGAVRGAARHDPELGAVAEDLRLGGARARHHDLRPAADPVHHLHAEGHSRHAAGMVGEAVASPASGAQARLAVAGHFALGCCRAREPQMPEVFVAKAVRAARRRAPHRRA